MLRSAISSVLAGEGRGMVLCRLERPTCPPAAQENQTVITLPKRLHFPVSERTSSVALQSSRMFLVAAWKK
jgi:hypothetical protein